MNLIKLNAAAPRLLSLNQWSILRQISTSSVISSDHQPTAPEFWERNKQLQRPLSPYVNYKLQMTSVLSITHRISGLGLGLPLYAMAIGQLFATTPWAHQLDALQTAFPMTFASVKFLILLGVSYHTFNGIRHLAWDLGKGFKINQLYASGYTVIALTTILTTILCLNLS